MFSITTPIKTREQAPKVCHTCMRVPCQHLYWDDIIVNPDPYCAPLDCPMRTRDEDRIRFELRRLDEFKVSALSGEVWGRNNYTPRYVYTSDHKTEEIEYIVGYVRKRWCAILCKSANPYYKPWKLFGFWANCKGLDEVITEPPEEKSNEEPPETAPTNTRTSPELHIDTFRHLDDSIAKERPDSVAEGDKILLCVVTKNIPDDEVVTIKVYNIAGTLARALTTLEGRVNSDRAEAEWVVEKDKKQEVTELEWDAGYQGVESARGKLPAASEYAVLLQIDVDDPAAKDDELILLDEGGSAVETLRVAEMKEIAEDVVRVVFKKIDPNKKYTLIRDYGAEDTGDHDPLFFRKTFGEL